MEHLYPAGYRNNDRVVIDDTHLAEQIFKALAPAVRPFGDADGDEWQPVACNPRIRVCRYQDGQAFTIHRDGAYQPSGSRRTWLTAQIYLNHGFAGGRTRFYGTQLEAEPRLSFLPQTGRLILFRHDYWHDGEAVTCGRKYVLRTDVVFERLPRHDHQGPPLAHSTTTSSNHHDGYIWALGSTKDSGTAEQGSAHCLSAGRDGTIKLWQLSASSDSLVGGQTVASLGRSITALQTLNGAIYYATRQGEVWRKRNVWLHQEAFRPQELVHQLNAAVTSLRVVRANQLQATCADGRVWRIATGESGGLPTLIRRHLGWAYDSTPDGASVGDDGIVGDRWPASNAGPTGEQGMDEQNGASLTPRALRCAVSMGNKLYVGDANGRVHTLCLETGRALTPPRQAHAGAVRALASAGGIVWSAGDDGKVVNQFGEVSARRHSDMATALLSLGGVLTSGGYDGRLLVHSRKS